jgi:hypothetical protein
MLEVATQDGALFRVPTTADTEEQPAAARIVQSCDLLGEKNGVALCNETDGSAELDSSSRR